MLRCSRAFCGFIWGVEIGAFPEKPAYDVMRAYLGGFFDMLKPSGIYRGRLGIAKQLVSLNEIIGYFPTLEPLLAVATSGKSPFWFQRAEFKSATALKAPFQVILILVTNFVRDRNIQNFTTMLNFLPAGEYYALLKQAFGTSLAKELLFEGSVRKQEIVLDSAPDRLYEGFLNTLQHMKACRDLFDGLRLNRTLGDDVSLLLGRFRAIHGWRVDLRSAQGEKRFTELRDFIDERIVERLGTVPDDTDWIRRSIQHGADEFSGIVGFWAPKATAARSGA
jgi:hypothetical protein